MKKGTLGVLICALLVLFTVQATWAAPPRSNPIVHIVRWGENLTSIARRYGTTIQAIVVANRLANSNRIYAGQRLVIPGGWAPSPVSGCVYIVQHGDTISGIAYRHGVSISSIVYANHIANPNRIYAGQRLVIPSAAPVPPTPAPSGWYYVVRRGDTLAKIALRFGTSVWRIATANNIANPNLIYPGHRLYIPKGTSPAPPTPTPSPSSTRPGCEHLQWPTAGARLSGIVRAWGTADHEQFGYYKLEYRKDGLDDWHYITGTETPVSNGALGTWDTRTVTDGSYTFRLVIVDQTGNYPPPCEISVHVNNDP
jgi:LysM repeat protein